MNLKQTALSVGLAAALVGSNAFAQNPEKDNAFAMALAEQCDMDKSGKVTKANFMKMMEMKWEKMAQGSKELSVANTAKIFMDTSRASN